jgi:FkbM family methyltransferase
MVDLFAKAGRYADEMRHCWRLGAGFSDRASLAMDTLLFHWQTARGKIAGSDTQAVRHCRIRLSHRMNSPVDFHYRLEGGDLFILHEVLLDGCYRIPSRLVDLSAGSPANPVTSIVDLGGNIGSATLSLAAQFPEASFVCVEPNPQNADVLRKNVAWLGGRARVVQAAIGDHDGVAQFNTEGAAWEGALGNGPHSIAVPCYRLETLLNVMNVEHVDILKVDIEAAERGTFASRGDWWGKVRLIVAELHNPYCFEDFDHDMRAIGLRAIPQDSAYGNAMYMAVRE